MLQESPEQMPFPDDAAPRSLLACLPWLWSRVLFPGRGEGPQPWCWRTLLFFLLVPGIYLYPCLSFYLFEPDEGRYAQIPREMLDAEEWVVPFLQGEPYLDKPPLFYWLVMLAYRVFGVHDWSARLVPALAIHVCVLVTYWFGRRSLGERPAFWGALVLALAPAFVGIGRLLILDGLLALCVSLAALCAWEAIRGTRLRGGWWTLSAVACGLGILTKGPVILFLLVPPLWLQRRLTGPGARISWRAVLVYMAIVALVALPWYVALCLRLPEFASYFLWEHNVVRFLMPFAHQQPVWYYGPVLFVGLLPATLLLVPFMRFLGSGRPEFRQVRGPELSFFLLAGLWCVAFFSISDCKLATYILPALPFFSLALGVFLVHGGWARRRITSYGAAGAVGLLMVAHYLAVPWVARARSPLNPNELVLTHCADRAMPVVCYPRNQDSVAFYAGRSDFQTYRSKDTPELVQELLKRPRTVVLFGHRHSLRQLKEVLPAPLRMVGEEKMGPCDMAIIERR